jgi:hypothetical protein
MAKSKRPVHVNLDSLRATLRDFGASDRELDVAMQKIVDETIVPTIRRGLSPVRGARNLAKYKNPAKYPGDRKPKGKPNLTLTGKMLEWYRATRDGAAKGKARFLLGISGRAPADVLVRAKANNEGTDAGVPSRPFIPNFDRGEEYSVTITSAFKRAFADAVKRALGKYNSNNKARRRK